MKLAHLERAMELRDARNALRADMALLNEPEFADLQVRSKRAELPWAIRTMNYGDGGRLSKLFAALLAAARDHTKGKLEEVEQELRGLGIDLS